MPKSTEYIANLEDLLESVSSASLTDLGAPLKLDSSVKVVDLASPKKPQSENTPEQPSVKSEDTSAIVEVADPNPPMSRFGTSNEVEIDIPKNYAPVNADIEAAVWRIEKLLLEVRGKLTDTEETPKPELPKLQKATISIKDLIDTEFDYYNINTVGQCVVFTIPTGTFNIKTRSSTKVELSVKDIKSECVLVERPIPLVNTAMDILIFFVLPAKSVDSGDKV